jgi:iron-sulfur cluster repair protein YtfE (RIC family)
MPTLVEKDACELLDADHIAVKHLFVEYARLATAGDVAGERRTIAMKICDELSVHAQIEEEIFYPALRGAIGEPELLQEAEAEHRQAKEMIAKIQAMDAADAAMDALVAALNRAIEHHVKEERDELFPKAKAAAQVDLIALGEQLRERQEQLQAQAA